jgi:cytochrome P450
MTPDEAGKVFVDPSAYADEGRFHQAATLLRNQDPVHRVDEPGYLPFWAVTRHADVMTVERDNAMFLSSPRPLLQPAEFDRRDREQGRPIRTLIHMDEPDHKLYRAVASDWFRPRQLAALEERVTELAARFVDRMAAMDGECDFVSDVALNFPLYVILSILGLPEGDFPRMLSLTQELFGGNDPELRRSEDPDEQLKVLMDFYAYFTELTAQRRANPAGDLASALANARVHGEYIPDLDLVSYYVIVATAGHDTTSSTIAGGLLALIENPDQYQRLRADPTLMTSAVEEMIRWVTPVKEFMRTASEDTELGGRKVAAGDSLYLAYLSANRDEETFADPFSFDIAREPNSHLAFGIGPHFCLGAQLARMEARLLFTEMARRIEAVELTGEPVSSATVFVGGLKRLPIHYRMAGVAG